MTLTLDEMKQEFRETCDAYTSMIKLAGERILDLEKILQEKEQRIQDLEAGLQAAAESGQKGAPFDEELK